MNTLGIDIGTTSICMVVYQEEEKKILVSRSVPNAFLPQGGFRQDAETIVRKVQNLLKEVSGFPFDAVGISAQMHGIVYVNAKGEAATPLYTWKEECGNLPFRGRESYAEYLSRMTGYPMYTGYGSVTHFYLRETGKIPADAQGFVDIGDYLAMRLTGSTRRRVNESLAASFGGFDLKKGRFDFEELRKAGVDTGFYPEICPWEKAAGFYEGKPVFTAVGDNQASFLGAVRDPETGIGVNVGTGSQVSVFARGLCVEAAKGGTDVRPFPGGGYLYVGASLNGGKVYERLAAFFAEVCGQFAGKVPDLSDIYEKMSEIAEKKQTTDLKAHPALYGRRGGPEDRETSGFLGLTDENFHPADLIRSYVRGMAEELAGLYEAFPEAVKKGRNSLTASGNGLRRNSLLREEVEKVFALPLTFSGHGEEAAAGAAIFAGRMAGINGL